MFSRARSVVAVAVAVIPLALGASACTVTFGTATGPQTAQGGGWQYQQQTYQGGGAYVPGPTTPPNANGAPQPQPIPAGVSPQPTPQPRVVGIPHVGGTQYVGVLPKDMTFGADCSTPAPLTGVLYFVPEGSQKIPDFSKLQPQGVTCADHLNVPLSNFDQGFPPNPNRLEWFGIRYDGRFQATKSGKYHFVLFSDDGSNLYIDGQKVIDNDGIHVTKRGDGDVTLAAGPHTIRVDYYQAYRWTVQLQLFVTPPDGQQVLWGSVI